MCRRALGDTEILQFASGKVINPAMNPNILPLSTFVGPGINDSRSLAEVLYLRSDVLLNQDGKSFFFRDTRKLEGSCESCEGSKEAIDGTMGGFRGYNRILLIRRIRGRY